MEDNFDIFELKKKFLTCTPLEKIKLPKKITAERQKVILDEIITDCLVQKYPVKNNYRRNFVRLLIERLENDNEEINDDLYEFFCSYLSGADSPMHYRHFLINSNQRVIIKESKSIISDGTTGLCSWQAAEVLAEWCLANKTELTGKSLVELGSGVGLTGLTILKTCRPRSYTFTDCHPRVLNLLQENIKLNTDLDHEDPESPGTDVQVVDLAWESIDEHKEANWMSPDLILAADVVYDSSLFPPLINATDVLLNQENSYAIIGITVRNEDTLSTFLTQLDNHKLMYDDLAVPTYKMFSPPCTPVKLIKITR